MSPGWTVYVEARPSPDGAADVEEDLFSVAGAAGRDVRAE
jgi:hypothetical protein